MRVPRTGDDITRRWLWGDPRPVPKKSAVPHAAASIPARAERTESGGVLAPLNNALAALLSDPPEEGFTRALERLHPSVIRGGAVYLAESTAFVPLGGRPDAIAIPFDSKTGATLRSALPAAAGGRRYLPLVDGRAVLGALELDEPADPASHEALGIVARLFTIAIGRLAAERMRPRDDPDLLATALFRELFDALRTAIVATNRETARIVMANRAFLELVGLEPAQVVGSVAPHAWWPGESDPTAEVRPVARTEALVRHRDGRLIPVEVERRPIRSPATGETTLVVDVITDLSERRQFERQLLQSGKLAAIGELAAGVAHEINNPLFAILGFVEFLLKDVDPGTKAHERLLLIQQTGLEIKDIVRALLDFAREPSGVFTNVELGEVVAEAVALVRRTTGAKDVEIVERFREEPLLLAGSSNQLKQIFLNLLTNAIQAMPNGGTVTVEVRRDEGFAVAVVSDTGPGIPEQVLPHVFEPFYTQKRDQGGTGLGLSVSLGIAQLHGGGLVAESRSGEGARFTLRLPLTLDGAR
jgi:PAS domain S-box-containing protein